MALFERRSRPPTSKMMLINTIFFGVGVGLVGFLWLSLAGGDFPGNVNSSARIDRHEWLLISTVAILFAGLFHSVLILHPKYREHSADLERTKLEYEGLRDLAMRDPLTSIYNRRFFESSLEAYIDAFSERKQPLGIMIIDLDFFKSINDEHGHDAGDYVLKKVSKTLSKISRSYDVVARIGGEEFAVIAPIVHTNDLALVAERFRHAIKNIQIRYDETEIGLSASIGVAAYCDGMEAKDLMLLADEKLYEAKDGGRDQVAA